MEYMQLVSSIMAAEHQAQAVAREAKERRKTLEADLARETEELRSSYQARAQARVEKVAVQEAEFAQESIDQLNAELERDLERIEAHYLANRDQWAEELFRQVVGDEGMTGYEALAAKVRAMYGKRLRMADYEHIASLSSETAVLDYLRNHPGWKRSLSSATDTVVDRTQLETMLRNELREEYVALNHFVPRGDKFVLSFPVMLCELNEILAALRRLAAEGRVKPRFTIPPNFLLHSRLDYTALSQCTDYSGLAAAAKDTIYGPPLRLFRPVEGRPLPDYTATEVLLRSTYYSTLYRYSSRNYAGETKRVLLRSLGQQVDLLNVTHILRLKKYFPGDVRYMSSLFPFNDRLKPAFIQALLEAPDVDSVLALLAASPYASVFAERDVPSLEAYYLSTFARFNHRQLSAGSPSVYTAIAYLNLKDLELKALINGIECAKYGAPFDPFLARLATGA